MCLSVFSSLLTFPKECCCPFIRATCFSDISPGNYSMSRKLGGRHSSNFLGFRSFSAEGIATLMAPLSPPYYLTHPFRLSVYWKTGSSRFISFSAFANCLSASEQSFSGLFLFSLPLLFSSPNGSRNSRHLPTGRALVRPSAIISADGVYSTLILPVLTSCCSQWL